MDDYQVYAIMYFLVKLPTKPIMLSDSNAVPNVLDDIMKNITPRIRSQIEDFLRGQSLSYWSAADDPITFTKHQFKALGNINVRDLPQTVGSKILGVLPKDTIVNVLTEIPKWFNHDGGGNSALAGWSAASYFEKIP